VLFRKEVYDLLNSKRRELSRDSLLWQYEKDAVEVTKVLLSYTDQMNKLALEIGRNEDQAKQLIYDHKNMVEKINVSRFLHASLFKHYVYQ
jgi:hypothetical protein